MAIHFDLIEICHWYRYEKASKSIGEHVSGHNWYPRPLPATPGHYIYRPIMPKLQKPPQNQIFWIFHIWPEIGHLRSRKFPETIKYPYMTFKAHFRKIEKNRHFRPKIPYPKFSRSILAGRWFPDNTVIWPADRPHRAPQTPTKPREPHYT